MESEAITPDEDTTVVINLDWNNGEKNLQVVFNCKEYQTTDDHNMIRDTGVYITSDVVIRDIGTLTLQGFLHFPVIETINAEKMKNVKFSYNG